MKYSSTDLERINNQKNFLNYNKKTNMTLEEILQQYEMNKTTINQNDNGDYDFDISTLDIKFNLAGTDFNPDKRTRKLEENTINQLQDVFDVPGLELKNATNGINFAEGLILVEHHQHKKVEDEIIPSGILVTKAGYWWFGIDDIGFIVLKKEFLLWCYEFNLKAKMLKDGPIASQEGWNTGYAFYIPYDKLAFLMRKYKEQL